MSQDRKTIAEYVQEAKTLFREEMFAICFIKELSDASKKAAVSVALRDGKIDFKRAVELVKALYLVVGEPDVFAVPAEKPPTVIAAASSETMAELLKYLKGVNANSQIVPLQQVTQNRGGNTPVTGNQSVAMQIPSGKPIFHVLQLWEDGPLLK